jgi:chaperonin GroES
MATKITPLGRNVLVKIEKEEKTSKGGIVIPDTANEDQPQEGLVVAVGSSEDIHEGIKPDCKVLFKKYAGSEIEVDDTKYLILDGKKEVLAVIE